MSLSVLRKSDLKSCYHLIVATSPQAPTPKRQVDQKSLDINIDEIQIAHSQIQYYRDTGASPTLEMLHLGLNIEGARYPPHAEEDAFMDHFNWTIKGFRYGGVADLSDLWITEAQGNSKDSSLLFSELRFLPRYSKEDFSKQLKYKRDRLDIA